MWRVGCCCCLICYVCWYVDWIKLFCMVRLCCELFVVLVCALPGRLCLCVVRVQVCVLCL